MRSQIQFLIVARTILTSVMMTGCISVTQVQTQQNAPSVVDPKTSMLSTLEGHARRTIGAVNTVVLSGDFMKALKLENPPQPIPIDVSNDMHKALDYLLGSPTAAGGMGGRFIYTPDPRFCSEVAAKNDPATCIETLTHVSFEQIMTSDHTGTIQARFDGLRPFLMAYGPSAAQVTVSAFDVVKMAYQIDVIRQAHGELQQPNGPSLAEGIVRADLVENSSTSETISLSIDSRLQLGGTNGDGSTYSLDVPVVTNALSLTFDTALSQGRILAQVPAFELRFPVNGSDQSMHEISAHFPGLSGQVSLDNTAKTLAAQAVSLGMNGLALDVDGSAALHAMNSKPLSAHITPDSDGNVTPCFDADFAFTADIPGFPGVIDPSSPVSFSAQAGTCTGF